MEWEFPPPKPGKQPETLTSRPAHFSWDSTPLAKQLAAVRLQQGQLLGRMQGLGFSQREEAVLTTLTEEVLKSSDIEGEKLDKNAVRS